LFFLKFDILDDELKVEIAGKIRDGFLFYLFLQLLNWCELSWKINFGKC